MGRWHIAHHIDLAPVIGGEQTGEGGDERPCLGEIPELLVAAGLPLLVPALRAPANGQPAVILSGASLAQLKMPMAPRLQPVT